MSKVLQAGFWPRGIRASLWDYRRPPPAVMRRDAGDASDGDEDRSDADDGDADGGTEGGAQGGSCGATNSATHSVSVSNQSVILDETKDNENCDQVI